VSPGRRGQSPSAASGRREQERSLCHRSIVADAAPFLSNPEKNVTLSIVAFAWRTAEYLAEEMRKGNV